MFLVAPGCTLHFICQSSALQNYCQAQNDLSVELYYIKQCIINNCYNCRTSYDWVNPSSWANWCSILWRILPFQQEMPTFMPLDSVYVLLFQVCSMHLTPLCHKFMA